MVSFCLLRTVSGDLRDTTVPHYKKLVVHQCGVAGSLIRLCWCPLMGASAQRRVSLALPDPGAALLAHWLSCACDMHTVDEKIAVGAPIVRHRAPWCGCLAPVVHPLYAILHHGAHPSCTMRMPRCTMVHTSYTHCAPIVHHAAHVVHWVYRFSW